MFKSCSRHCERSSVVEHHLAKVGVAGSNVVVTIIFILWSVGQGVKTPPFHGGNTGSNPVRTISFWRITQVRLKGTVLKTVRRVKACVGSNPTSSLIILSRDGAAR